MSKSIRHFDSLNRYGNFCTAKIGFAPLLPEYALKHELGTSVAAATNFGTLAIAKVGYEACELFVQDENHMFPTEHNFIKQHLDHDTFTVLNNQGSDFFAGAFYAHLAGGAAAETLRTISHIAFGNKWPTRFIENNYRTIRSTIGFMMLAGHEYNQAGGNLSKLDVKDLAAYATGIVTICHGPQITKGITKTFQNTKEFFFGKKDKPQKPKLSQPTL